ncbi:MAG: 16S rRNA processing protein RimM [Dehalococcoidia bacterium]|nr:16S rRNA processing protein RimM [Dehalococcoidia bacterium]
MTDGLPPSGGLLSRNLIEVGRILTVWGIKGDLKVEAWSDNPHRFDAGQQLVINGAPHTIERSKPFQKGLLVKLVGVDTRNEAELLRGCVLEVPSDQLMALPEGHYFIHQLVGLAVATTDGRPLGTLQEVLRTPSNDVYVVKDAAREYLIPAIADVVQEVDLDTGTMLIEAIPGLLD